MFIRVNSDGRISGVSADSTSLAHYEGSSIIDVGDLAFPTKTVIREICCEKQCVDENGDLVFDEFNAPVCENAIENYQELVSMDRNPDDFFAQEVAAFVKQAKITEINNEYTGDDGIITKLRMSALTLLVNGLPVTTIKNQIATKTVEMQNKIKEVH